MQTFASLIALGSLALAAPIPSVPTNPASALSTSVTASNLPSSTSISVSVSMSSFDISSMASSVAGSASSSAIPSFSSLAPSVTSVVPTASTTLSAPFGRFSAEAFSASVLDIALPTPSASASTMTPETETKTRERLLAYTSSLFDEIKALLPKSMQLTLSAFKPELIALAARYASARARAVAASLHTPYSGQAPGEQALFHSLYALETHLAQAQADAADNAARWTWYTTVFVNMVRDDMLWALDSHIALEHLIRAAGDAPFSAESIAGTPTSASGTLLTSTPKPTSLFSITATPTPSSSASLL